MKNFKKTLLIIFGTIFVFLGIIGLMLPIVPTTPFLILAGILYINSSKKLYARLIKIRYFGPEIESYVERREVTRNFKVCSLLFIIVPTIITQFFIGKNWILRIFPILFVVIVVWHILSLKTVNKDKIFSNSNQTVKEEERSN
ncbi:YbaN family protein [Mycoplasmatota bacterium]|nr:YbaN family protein [Mycoplasmatota bacterium]